ncbi:unnamed protein product [Nippostrongylus brasiliensis]|uniref:ULP_PROTEASE domain-containing protein n=1 Tax=Nippostrongylus brasiliensis TaxID=27835 RepID=A0A158R3J0_NIPBR|nr:unnamed protein product [Nippostrongylus brasiliensis]
MMVARGRSAFLVNHAASADVPTHSTTSAGFRPPLTGSADDRCCESDFPFLCSKPSGGEGKRTKGKRCGSNVAAGAAPSFIMKTRRKARVLSECADNLAPGVMYSMDKKNRWAQSDAAALLDGVNGDEVDGQVVETTVPPPVYYYKWRNVVAVHEVDDDGSLVSKTAKGRGATSVSCLTSPPREKQRGCRARREIAARLLAEEEERNGIPNRACGIHLSQNILPGASPKSRRVRVKRVDLSELEQSELEQSVHIEQEGFCLGDYMTEKVPAAAVHVRQDSVDSTKYPLDIEKVVEALRDQFTVRWLDVNYQRVLIDATNALPLNKRFAGEPTVVVVLERCWHKEKALLRVFLNTTVESESGFTWKAFKNHLIQSAVSDVGGLVEATLRLPKRWLAQSEVPVDELVKLKQRKEHLPSYNVMTFARQAHLITGERMADLLREECVQLDVDSFEKIGQDDFESELEEPCSPGSPSEVLPVPTGVKCESCGTTWGNNLYEMDDCWMCRNCLKQLIIHHIRVKLLPVNLPLVVPEGVTSYDVLPSIIPLTLFNFYTKVGESERFAKCNNCNIAFDPHTMQFVVVEDRILPNLYVPRIKKEVVKICEKARNYRFETTKLNELEKTRKLNDSVAGVEKLRDIRKMVLYIIEYGMAWIHMEKSIADRALIKTNLVSETPSFTNQKDSQESESRYTRTTAQIRGIAPPRPKFAESVEALNTFAQKTIDLIKKHL